MIRYLTVLLMGILIFSVSPVFAASSHHKLVHKTVHHSSRSAHRKPIHIIETPAAAKRCIALTVAWEAQGSTVHDQRGIGWTVLNRTKSKDFPHTCYEVVHQRGQFPEYRHGTPAAKKHSVMVHSLEVAEFTMTHPPPKEFKDVLFFNQKGGGIDAHVKLHYVGDQFEFFRPITLHRPRHRH